MQVHIRPLQSIKVRLEWHIQRSLHLWAFWSHKWLFRGKIPHTNTCSITVLHEFLLEEAALREAGELHLLKFTALADTAQHERSIMLKALRSELGFLDWDATNALDGIEPELRMTLADGATQTGVG
jgi:hypothetical protein